jgi:transcriptional regulator with XRE-family HTH domain
MPRADASRSARKTKLAEMRLKRDLSQRDMELATGISMSTLQRLESGELKDPRLGALVNCALALDCSIEELVEDESLVFRYEPALPYLWRGPALKGRVARLCRRPRS